MSESGGCFVGEGIVVCSPRGNTYRSVRYCPTCKQRRRFIVTLYVWYGIEAACCACGDRWSDGERESRPFSRGWRIKASRDLRERWKRATTKRAAMAWLMAEVEAYRA